MDNIYKILIIFLILFYNSISYAYMVESSGDAVIYNNDINTAKHTALLRAKWAAVESTGEAKIKVDSLLNNSKILYEAVETEISASISSYKVIEEKIVKNKYIVKIKADILEKTADSNKGAKKDIKSLCVIIAGVMPNGDMDLNNTFSLEAVNTLNNKGFNVTHLGQKENIALINNIIKNSDYGSLNKIRSKYKCSNILAGKINIINKGSNTGYGNFNIHIAAGEFNYKLFNSKNKIIKTGNFSSRGQGATFNDAAISIYKNMAKNNADVLSSQIGEVLYDNSKKSIRVVLSGSNTSLDDYHQLQEDIKIIPFVLKVEEKGLNSLIVDFPEKTIYLGIFLEKDNKYKIEKISDNEIILRK